MLLPPPLEAVQDVEKDQEDPQQEQEILEEEDDDCSLLAMQSGVQTHDSGRKPCTGLGAPVAETLSSRYSLYRHKTYGTLNIRTSISTGTGTRADSRDRTSTTHRALRVPHALRPWRPAGIVSEDNQRESQFTIFL